MLAKTSKLTPSIYITRTKMRFFVFLVELFLISFKNKDFNKKLAEINEKSIER